MIAAVFFDLYGTLAGFKPSRYEIQSTACADFGISVTPDGILRGYRLADAFMAKQNRVRPLRSLSDTERDDFFAGYEQRVLKGSDVEVTVERAAQIWRRVRQVPYAMALFDDVAPTLETLRSRGLTLGVVTNMNRGSGEILADFGLEGRVDFAVTSIEARSEKPHAPIFREALRRANAEPRKVVHVGDQLESDVEGARRVGITPVLLDRDGNHPDVTHCHRIEALPELPALLESLARAGGASGLPGCPT